MSVHLSSSPRLPHVAASLVPRKDRMPQVTSRRAALSSTDAGKRNGLDPDSEDSDEMSKSSKSKLLLVTNSSVFFKDRQAKFRAERRKFRNTMGKDNCVLHCSQPTKSVSCAGSSGILSPGCAWLQGNGLRTCRPGNGRAVL
ncbi:uncharacterized protein LOC108603010 [Drosophila busckii]|uniref:uncharacterized protein LOC108603010 n=1 Tax=Drosophila busckii TaxID=30019 RepID=UPI00083EC549|nr:uncharacterized protein LOC108603010 [Drosophila busckii]